MCRQVWSWQWWLREMEPDFLSVTWCREAFHGLGVHDVESLVWVMLYFYLMEEGEGKNEKKNCCGERGFTQGWTCLAVCIAGCSCLVQLKADLRDSI
jgi:hypothetical protein